MSNNDWRHQWTPKDAYDGARQVRQGKSGDTSHRALASDEQASGSARPPVRLRDPARSGLIVCLFAWPRPPRFGLRLCPRALPNFAVLSRRRRYAAALARRQRRALPWQARAAHAGPRVDVSITRFKSGLRHAAGNRRSGFHGCVGGLLRITDSAQRHRPSPIPLRASPTSRPGQLTSSRSPPYSEGPRANTKQQPEQRDRWKRSDNARRPRTRRC